MGTEGLRLDWSVEAGPSGYYYLARYTDRTRPRLIGNRSSNSSHVCICTSRTRLTGIFIYPGLTSPDTFHTIFVVANLRALSLVGCSPPLQAAHGIVVRNNYNSIRNVIASELVAM